MVKKMKDNFLKGIAKVRLFAFFFSERLKVEIAVMKLLFRSDEVARQKDEHLKSIGLRVLRLKDQREKEVLKDREITEALAAVAKLDQEISDLKEKISELSRVTDS